jgi:hypothetical protein
MDRIARTHLHARDSGSHSPHKPIDHRTFLPPEDLVVEAETASQMRNLLRAL